MTETEKNMDKIVKNLENMKTWVNASLPLPAAFKTNAEAMRFVAEVMNRCLYLLRIGTASAPNAETAQTGYTKPQAIIAGHMVQLAKLYEGALIHICGAQPELTRIFLRPILEVAIDTGHLIKSKGRLQHRTISDTYLTELKVLRGLEDKTKTQSLTPIERHINKFILSPQKKEGIVQSELVREASQNIDRKSSSQFCEGLGYNESLYLYLLHEETDCVHRDWDDIRSNHLTQKGDYYVPDLSMDQPDPRLGCQLTQVCLETLLTYLDWNKADPDGTLTSIIQKLHRLNTALDALHENSLAE